MYNHVSNDEAVADLFSQRCADDPHAVYHEVQAQCPVHRSACSTRSQRLLTPFESLDA